MYFCEKEEEGKLTHAFILIFYTEQKARKKVLSLSKKYTDKKWKFIFHSIQILLCYMGKKVFFYSQTGKLYFIFIIVFWEEKEEKTTEKQFQSFFSWLLSLGYWYLYSFFRHRRIFIWQFHPIFLLYSI